MDASSPPSRPSIEPYTPKPKTKKKRPTPFVHNPITLLPSGGLLQSQEKSQQFLIIKESLETQCSNAGAIINRASRELRTTHDIFCPWKSCPVRQNGKYTRGSTHSDSKPTTTNPTTTAPNHKTHYCGVPITYMNNPKQIINETETSAYDNNNSNNRRGVSNASFIAKEEEEEYKDLLRAYSASNSFNSADRRVYLMFLKDLQFSINKHRTAMLALVFRQEDMCGEAMDKCIYKMKKKLAKHLEKKLHIVKPLCVSLLNGGGSTTADGTDKRAMKTLLRQLHSDNAY